MTLVRYLADIPRAFDNLRAQKTRTVLTALGIVFGVGSVIGMLAIGAGAREESLAFIEQLGVRNVLVESIPASSLQEIQQRRRSSPGLSERDVRILEANVESLETLVAAPHPASGASAAQALAIDSEREWRAPVVCRNSQSSIVGRTLLFLTRRHFEALRCACSAIAPR